MRFPRGASEDDTSTPSTRPRSFRRIRVEYPLRVQVGACHLNRIPALAPAVLSHKCGFKHSRGDHDVSHNTMATVSLSLCFLSFFLFLSLFLSVSLFLVGPLHAGPDITRSSAILTSGKRSIKTKNATTLLGRDNCSWL